MMIVGGPRELRGRTAVLDRLQGESVVARFPGASAWTRTFRVTEVMLTAEEAAQACDAGVLRSGFEVVSEVNGMFRIRPKRGQHRAKR